MKDERMEGGQQEAMKGEWKKVRKGVKEDARKTGMRNEGGKKRVNKEAMKVE